MHTLLFYIEDVFCFMISFLNLLPQFLMKTIFTIQSRPRPIFMGRRVKRNRILGCIIVLLKKNSSSPSLYKTTMIYTYLVNILKIAK